MKIFPRFFSYAILPIVMAACFLAFCSNKAQKIEPVPPKVVPVVAHIPDTTKIGAFFESHAQFKLFEDSVKRLYRTKHRSYWFSNHSLTEPAQRLLLESLSMEHDGIFSQVPYRAEVEALKEAEYSDEREFLLTALYFYYFERVYEGLPAEQISATGWFIPRKHRDYVAMAERFASDKTFLDGDTLLVSQYYQLRKSLQKYREIADRGGWRRIEFPAGTAIEFGESHDLVPAIRKRLALEGYAVDTIRSVFDDDLLKAVNEYQLHHNRKADSTIRANLVSSFNISAADRVKTIALNMERCRWVTDGGASEYIAVNIPSYQMYYFRDGKPFLQSRVVVGKALNKTVVFNGEMSEIVFAPYWNVPKSILVKEILPAIKRNPNYLRQHQMEWFEGRVRQRPGKNNSLGLVKFMFPNSNNIYLHDTPQKALFDREERAFSHGCIRLQKARDLAIALMSRDFGWDEKKVDDAMNSGTQKAIRLKTRIPVYIAYFTALADSDGKASFYHDIYDRDATLDSLLTRGR